MSWLAARMRLRGMDGTSRAPCAMGCAGSANAPTCGVATNVGPLGPLSRLRVVDTPVELPKPRWLAAYSDPLIEAMIEDLGGDWALLYVRYLGDEVRRNPRRGFVLAWLAFDRAEQEIQRRNRRRRRA